jgi:hypothetical protein
VKNLYLSETQDECKLVRDWVRNIYFLSTNQFLDLKMLEASNNMATQRGDYKIVTYIHYESTDRSNDN